MLYHFPYYEDRPHIPLILEHKGKGVRFLPLLDSGADFSIFPKLDAYRLNLDWDKGEKRSLVNSDGSSFEARQFSLNTDVEGTQFKMRICFLDGKQCPIPVLGRTDFFRHFRITIDEAAKMVELKKRKIRN